MNVITAITSQSSDWSSSSVPQAGVSRIPAIPATITIARIGSERASTSMSSSSFSASKTSSGLVSTRGTSRHHARTRGLGLVGARPRLGVGDGAGLERLLVHPASVAPLSATSPGRPGRTVSGPVCAHGSTQSPAGATTTLLKVCTIAHSFTGKPS